MFRSLRNVVLVLGACLAVANPAGATAPFEIRVKTGDAAPGTS